MTASAIANGMIKSLKRNSPKILMGLGISGMVGTVVMAVRATPKALEIIREEKENRPKCISSDENSDLTKREIVELTWKCYIPAVIMGGVSIACLLGSSSVSARRNAALAAAYTLSDTALREYKEEVVKEIGEKKEQLIQDSVAKKKIEQNPVSHSEVILTEKGNTLCYDAISGRYFKSDVDRLNRAVNEINRQLLSDGFVMLNDFYYEIGLSGIKIGSELGWNANRGLVDLNFSTQLSEDNTPCLVLDFAVAPRYDY